MSRRRYKHPQRYSTGGAVPIPDTNAPAPAPVDAAPVQDQGDDDNALARQLEQMRQAEQHAREIVAARERHARDLADADRLAGLPSEEQIERQIERLPGLSRLQKEWLKQHPDAYTDPHRNAVLGDAHGEALNAGIALDSDDYFALLGERLGYAQARRIERNLTAALTPPPPPHRSVPVSAPVSRDAVSLTNGYVRPSQVKLSPEQREAARIAGVDEATYARNFLRMQEMKKAGHYQERG